MLLPHLRHRASETVPGIVQMNLSTLGCRTGGYMFHRLICGSTLVQGFVSSLGSHSREVCYNESHEQV